MLLKVARMYTTSLIKICSEKKKIPNFTGSGRWNVRRRRQWRFRRGRKSINGPPEENASRQGHELLLLLLLLVDKLNVAIGLPEKGNPSSDLLDVPCSQFALLHPHFCPFCVPLKQERWIMENCARTPNKHLMRLLSCIAMKHT